ncbi:GAF domain-containing sensor histidine kinase [Chryseobacterium gleum]|uniref:GAF domain-containing sensor histidine kinase n=1 Tax=Chryseobacterium gleum TaxID=250 RepID=UPI00241EC14F|nr:GAF domain-containing sensor histidine kinase [Chryseobacterium gleum]
MGKFFTQSSYIPEDDQARITKLGTYGVMETHNNPAFDTIAGIAADIFDSSGAFVNFVDSETVFFKANLSSFPSNHVERQHSLCSLTVLSDDITIIYDTHLYDDLRENPYVCCDGGIRFYAGAPIVTEDGYRIGTVCVIDSVPRKEVTDLQCSILKKLVSLALDKLESMKAKRMLAKVADDRFHHVAHDLFNPLTVISLSAQQIQRSVSKTESVYKLGSTIFEKAKSIEYNISNMLKDDLSGEKYMHLSIISFETDDIINCVSKNFSHILKNKGQHLDVCSTGNLNITGDKQRIMDILGNFLSNASKYSSAGSKITLKCEEQPHNVVFSVTDQGQGICPSEIGLLFKKFSCLSSRPTANERSHGLGLYSAKILADLHHGKVWAESAGKDLGSSFFLQLPKD